jgi:hypothetical protein
MDLEELEILKGENFNFLFHATSREAIASVHYWKNLSSNWDLTVQLNK